MNIIVRIPDTLASRLGADGPALERQALEALVLESCRSGRMTTDEAREALGFDVLDQVDGFLKAHGVYEDYSVKDVDRQVETIAALHGFVLSRGMPCRGLR